MKTSWKTKKLDDACEVEYGTRVVNKKHGGSKYPVYGGGGATFFMDRFNRGNRMVIARFAMSEQCTRFVKDEFFLNDSGLTLSPKDTEEISQDFLNWQTLSLNDQIYSLAKGSAQKNLDVPAFRKMEIVYPKSLSEQKRIVKTLDDVFEKVAKVKENAEKNLQNSKELFESYLQSVFANPGKNWEEISLGNIGKISMCKRVFKGQTTKTGDIPFYKIGTFGKEPNAFISGEIYDEFRKKFSFPKKGDILISASGTIGRRVKYDGKPGYFQDSNIVWIDNDERQVLNDYLYHFYGACNWDSTKGATISRLYNDNLKKIRIPFPKSLLEQKTIIKKLDGLAVETKKLEKIYEQKLASLEELKKSVLQQTFTGKL